MPNYRMDRTSEDIMRELTAILRTVKDPRVTGSMLSILRVEVTRDMSYATVYVTSMNGIEAAREAVKGLKSAAGYMRHALGTALSLRHTPELRFVSKTVGRRTQTKLRFVADDSIEYSANIAATLNRLKKEHPHDQ